MGVHAVLNLCENRLSLKQRFDATQPLCLAEREQREEAP
jgi:hypothetical protein